MAHQSSSEYRPFSALVLAGSRPGGDPLASLVGATSKASIRIAGTPMLVLVAGDPGFNDNDFNINPPDTVLTKPPLEAAHPRPQSRGGRHLYMTPVVDYFTLIGAALRTVLTAPWPQNWRRFKWLFIFAIIWPARIRSSSVRARSGW